jgi:hypothetical protein
MEEYLLMPIKPKAKNGSTLNNYFGYSLRLVDVISDASPTLPVADTIVSAT